MEQLRSSGSASANRQTGIVYGSEAACPPVSPPASVGSMPSVRMKVPAADVTLERGVKDELRALRQWK